MNDGQVVLFISFISLVVGILAGAAIKTRPWRSIIIRVFLIAIPVFVVTVAAGLVSTHSTLEWFSFLLTDAICTTLFVAFGLLVKHLTVRLTPKMKRNVVIAVLALLWITINAAHAYTFFRGNASNPYVKCLTEGWSYCGNAYPKQRAIFEQDRVGVTLKSVLNAAGLALVACFLIIGMRRECVTLK